MNEYVPLTFPAGREDPIPVLFEEDQFFAPPMVLLSTEKTGVRLSAIDVTHKGFLLTCRPAPTKDVELLWMAQPAPVVPAVESE